ncbi:MAG: hypothetical protein Q7R99_03100 [bacterium]|nr:hypothetical protein [bacterium]
MIISFKFFSVITFLLVSFCLWFTIWGIQNDDIFFVLVFWPFIVFTVLAFLAYVITFIARFQKLDKKDKLFFRLVFLLPLLQIALALAFVYLI